MAMGHREKWKGGVEADVFSDWRKYYCYLSKSRVVHWVKKKASRRYRREEKERLHILRSRTESDSKPD
jgi:hypothetical protein